ncbi:MAG: hypothetical protein WDM86_20270 [Rhizomicrobium sp.]
MAPATRTLIEKIEALPAETISEVEDFVDFVAIRARDRVLMKAAARMSETSFSRAWNNPEDDVYDAI